LARENDEDVVRRNPRQRQRDIATTIRESGRVSVERLAQAFGVSAETIRRDLAALDRAGLVEKTHGGATPPRVTLEDSLAQRIALNPEAKRAIAARLAAVIQPGDTLFLDTGSTTLACAEALAELPGLTVITNSVDIARRLGERAHVHLIGGRFAPGNGQTVGAAAVREVARFRARRAVLTVTALDAVRGAMDADAAECEVARAMLEAARECIVLADSSKFGVEATHVVCPLSQIDVLISDAPPPPELSDALAAAGTRLA
jgi:DeoR family glycerol-3-phosphate regulon repressor